MHEDERYTDALIREFDLRLPSFRDVGPLSTLYFGGGTPSLWSRTHLSRFYKHVLSCCQITDDFEVTLELNPEDMTLSELAALRDLGVNRLSVGAQSLDDEVLRLLGRAHSGADVIRCVGEIKRAGFDNWTVDLIHGVHNQSLASANHDVERIIDLGTPHISTYQLTIEPGTRFATRAARGEPVSLDEGYLETMYQSIEERAASLGLVHYEVSNAARPGFESKHNLGYWLGRTYMGLGPGAHGLSPDGSVLCRYGNRSGVKAYIARMAEPHALHKLATFRDVIDADTQSEDLLMTGLRLKAGIVPTSAMAAKYGERVTNLCREGLMRACEGRWLATSRGRLLLDYVLRRLLT